MKTLAFASLLPLALVGCTDDADIGVESDPIQCMQTAAADMSGSVEYNGQTYNFENASPTLTRDTTGAYTTVSLWSSENPDTQRGNYLRFFFQCGAPENASYDVVQPGPNQQVNCPFEVTSSVAGSIEILPATTGVMIVDQTQGCLAGRFRVDLDNAAGSGSIGGWYSIPWQ